MVKSARFVHKLMFFITLLLFGLQQSVAEPADWYRWESKLNGKMICKQISPGEGWQQHAGPFYDARCTKLKFIRTSQHEHTQ